MRNIIQRIIDLFSSYTPQKQTLDEVHRWLINGEHSEEKDKALENLWNNTEGLTDAKVKNALSYVYARVECNNKPKSKFNRIRIGYAAAAVALLVLSIGSTYVLTKDKFASEEMIENLTEAGKMKTIILPDGSIAQTNSGTILFYPKSFKGDTRTVHMIGEANFKVKKDDKKPFIIRSGSVSVTAVGTEFNVAAYPDNNEIVTTLIHGKVLVSCNNEHDSYILMPGQQVVYTRNSGKSKLTKANLEDVCAWQKGMFVFRGMSIQAILSSLEKRFGIAIQHNNNLFNDDKYNFHFRENSDFNEIMDIMKEVVGGFNYRLEGDTCYLKTSNLK